MIEEAYRTADELIEFGPMEIYRGDDGFIYAVGREDCVLPRE